jgi:superfamily II DNA or RNA helicase
LLEARGLEYEKLSGTSPKKVKDSIVRRLSDGSIKLVIAGASILKDGVNIPQATGTIIAGAGRGGKEQHGLIQQAGRLLRTAEGKGQPAIYIIDDDCHTLFSNQSRALITACAKTYGKDSVIDYTYGTKR